MSELRKNPITEGWVIISTERSKRPGDFNLPPVEKKGGFCPFCEGNEGSTPPETFSLRNAGKPDEPGWSVRVVPNKFPAVKNEGSPDRTSKGIYEMINGAGAHEVIVETTRHDVGLVDLGIKSFSEVLSTYRSRLLSLRSDPRLEYIMLFRNNGLLAGASLEHPHTQLVGLPIVPVAITDELDGASSFHKKTGHCIFCEMIDSEIEKKDRLIMADDNFVAFCPFAPRFPFETWVFPRAHMSNFEDIDDDLLQSFAGFYKEVLTKLKNVLNDPPYNFMLHTAPVKSRGLKHFHWHIEITPCLTQIAGFERGTGYYINPTPPEEAAKHMREMT